MHYTLNAVDRHHQVNLTESAPVSLFPKRCVCGKPAFAKQLAQYGVCIACQLAARVASLEPEDLDILRFMLGVKQSPRATWGNRNTYLCNRRDQPSMARLLTAGFVESAAANVEPVQHGHASVGQREDDRGNRVVVAGEIERGQGAYGGRSGGRVARGAAASLDGGSAGDSPVARSASAK